MQRNTFRRGISGETEEQLRTTTTRKAAKREGERAARAAGAGGRALLSAWLFGVQRACGRQLLCRNLGHGLLLRNMGHGLLMPSGARNLLCRVIGIALACALLMPLASPRSASAAMIRYDLRAVQEGTVGATVHSAKSVQVSSPSGVVNMQLWQGLFQFLNRFGSVRV